MLIDVVVIAFISVYCALVLLGHILIAIAIWPNLFPKRRARVLDDQKAGHGEGEPALETGAVRAEALQGNIAGVGVSEAGLPPRRVAA